MAWTSPKQITIPQPKPDENTWEELAALEDQFPVFTRIPQKSVNVVDSNLPAAKSRLSHRQKKVIKSSSSKPGMRKYVTAEKKHASTE